MFTGLIDDVGTIERITSTDAGLEFRVACRYDDLVDGESIALNGVCLTVREHGPQWFSVAAVVTTLGRTTVGTWNLGTRVNLERALRAGDRLGGHLVQGHVDGVGRVASTHVEGDALLIDVEIPLELFDLMVPHGSICVDGVSLTVNALPSASLVQLSIIDYTARHTTLGTAHGGQSMNIEADIIGKYVRRLVGPYAQSRTSLAEQIATGVVI